MPSYWLMKSEPGTYSIDDLARDGSTAWSGVRNFQARNFMRDQMKIGDGVLFYHSSAEPTGVAGIAEVSKAGYPEPGEPDWTVVNVTFVEKFAEVVSLEALKASSALAAMKVVQRGMRLSVQPVTAGEWKEVLKMARKKRG